MTKTLSLFRKLTPDEEASFRKWARDNYKPFTLILGIWHPITQDECRKMNEEAGMEQPGTIQDHKGNTQ